MYKVVSGTKSKFDESESVKSRLLDLMVEYYILTHRVFLPGGSYRFEGDPEKVVDEIERVVDKRWIRQASFEFQIIQVARALQRLNLYKTLLDFELRE